MAVRSQVRFSELTDDLRLDAEYYRPENLTLEGLLSKEHVKKWGEIDGNFIVGPFGSAFLVENYVRHSPFRYIRGRDVRPFFLADDENCYISRKDFGRLGKHAIGTGDLLVSVVGTLGNISIITDDVGRAIFSCKSTAFRSKSLDPYYLCAYLNSPTGQSWFQRMTRGHVQTGLNLTDLKNMPIMLPTNTIQKNVSTKVREAHSKLQESERLYEDAQNLLLSELGLDSLDPSPVLSYERPYSEAVATHRLDAEYYRPRYYQLMKSLEKAAKAKTSARISSISTPLRYGTSDKLSYTETGVPFLRLADLENRRFDLATVLRISSKEAVEQKAAEAHARDVLVSRSGTLGVAVAIPDELQGAIFGSYFIRVQPDRTKVHPDFLALYINSSCGSLQVERLNTGTVQTNLTISAIESIYVVFGDLGWQEIFVKKVRESIRALQESKRLIKDAKRIVEESVRKGEK